jgi:hypothetical protein
MDVSSLAYAYAPQLMRTTTYSPRQLVDWIDESLLIVNLPSHWEAMEKLGVTGAMDLAWYVTSPDSITELAAELRINRILLENVVTRLSQDAQVVDLYELYWDHSDVQAPIGPRRPPAAVPAQERIGGSAVATTP